ncbi:MAG TPA: carboxypeptidase regulatory-like domain-containing protein [Nocardioides sp.]|nr:carboxypeptidase regulatory-like domain-containing protein [Nocardioides sp.]
MSTTRNPGARRAALPSAVLLATGLATASSGLHPPATAAAGPDGAAGWVTGVVVDTAGNPVEGAMVTVLPPRQVPERGVLDPRTSRTDLTDAAGEFRVRQSSRGFLVMVCEPEPEAPGACKETVGGVDYLLRYVGPDGQLESWMQHTRLFDATAAELELGEIEVQPQAEVLGTIEGANHELVQLMRGNDTVAFNQETDARGNYSFKGLVPGEYYVRAGGEGSLPWESEPVTIDAEQRTRVDGSLQRGVTLTGRLLEDGAPAGRSEVFLADEEGEWIASLLTDRRGRFELTGLTPGDYQVGPLRRGGPFLVHGEPFSVAPGEEELHVDVPVTRGATVTVRFDPEARGRIDNELRDADGELVNFNLGREGTATFEGLAPGTYTLVAKDERRYGLRTIRVRKLRGYDIGTLDLDQRLLTLRGTTAPGAVVEATTGSFCPPDAPMEYAGFHEISDRAAADGSYVLRGLTPGHYMVAADGFPGNYAPTCHDDVKVWSSRRYDVPLQPGNVVSGRMVYAGTDRPVIAPLSYGLTYPGGLVTNPTQEHPSADRVDLATGGFAVDRVPTGDVTGALATETGDGITHRRFVVYFPYSDGSPYWLESAEQPITVDGDIDLGDVELVLRSGPPTR